MGMWVIHKLNDSIEECKAGDSSQYESIDKAAAFWIGSVSADDNGGILYELAEQLGEHISHNECKCFLSVAQHCQRDRILHDSCVDSGLPTFYDR